MSPSNKNIARALRDAPRLVVATVALMEELIRVLTQEIDVVSMRKLKEHPDLLKHKQKLAMDYRANMKSIATQPDILKALTDDAKAAIKEMAYKLAEAAELNARILRAAVGATQQLIQNIVAMVRTEVMPRQSYKNPAMAHLQLGGYSPTCAPVAYNRSV
jgi:flagellar biosynthesis/type III secretory pathway chaperone